jgi:hypothetical protein
MESTTAAPDGSMMSRPGFCLLFCLALILIEDGWL